MVEMMMLGENQRGCGGWGVDQFLFGKQVPGYKGLFSMTGRAVITRRGSNQRVIAEV